MVTADAMFTHADFGREVRKAGGDDFLAVKDNQPTLPRDIKAAFAADTALPPSQRRRREAARSHATTVDKGHGRRERRALIASTERTADLRPHWPDLGQVCRITRERWEKGKHTVEVAYRITSLEPERAGAERLLALDRGHWGIGKGCTTCATSAWARTPVGFAAGLPRNGWRR